MFGFTFIPVGGGNTIKLGTVTVKDGDSADVIQVLNPETLDPANQYIYYSDGQAQAEAWEEAEGNPEVYEEVYAELKELVGWWSDFVGGTSANDEDIPVGSGFLGSSINRNNMKFTCSGEAPTTSKSFTTGAVKSPTVANFLPADCYLKDIMIENGDSADVYQDLNPETLDPANQYIYYSDDQARAEAWEEAEGNPEVYEEVYAELKDLVGWWSDFVGGTSADYEVMKAGQAFLGSSINRNNCKFNFKGVLDLTPIVKE